jgi:4-hydroxy-tetrahydrodipicolinate reductase
VIGPSELTASDYDEIDETARRNNLGNFSITAALAKHFALFAARPLPSWEIIDYAYADKPDAPSGTTRELAEELASTAQNRIEVPITQTHGNPQARGATIARTQVHSVRLSSYVIAIEAILGLPEMSDRPFDTVHGSPTWPYRVRVLMLSCSQMMRLAYPETQRTRMQDNSS